MLNRVLIKYKYCFLFLSLYGIFLFISLNRDSKVSIFTYQSEFWADKAGYHVYLPYLFIYNGNGNAMPESIAINAGEGFSIDSITGKVITKYPYGTALLQSPFYLASLPFLSYQNPQGAFGINFQRTINIAACFYGLMGLFLLFFFLRKIGFSNRVVWLSVVSIFLSTNIVYYCLFECGMSHIYSFFAFCLLLWSFTQENEIFKRFLIGLSVGLIIAIRPINVIYIPLALVLVSRNLNQYLDRSKSFFNIISILMIALVIVPQFVYWKYTFGSWIYYSYQGEGFTNIARPPILNFLFSTRNGLLLYAPILIFSFWGIFKMFKDNQFQSIVLLFGLIYFVWISASWWIWSYGCSYGCRPFVELNSVYCFPLCVLLEQNRINNKRFRYILISILLLIICNIKFIYSSDNCWFYGDWDFHKYYQTLIGSTN